MSNEALDSQKYPIGKFTAPASYTQQQMLQWIDDIKTLPGRLHQALMGLTETQMDTPYRPGGWTIRQVVHHVADSHANAFIRLKWALTEENPTIKAYEEGEWALLPDYKLPIEPTLRMLEGLHLRWVAILETLDDDQWNRTFVHPASGEVIPVRKLLGLYAWHGNHHLAHINGVKF
ncbi:DinB family protein [Mucilaginibacter gracilis]|uniref:DinB family protein n=1 Tax=Mucilaginibacter gracilis TaxID=423350 RepID=A0A495IYJ2_9SPHI|nr:putative metal-dependent hydrolase [Mucilaginibacter gracilis]RKR81451.1 DinB family protein [Mucilaginibacter gracilis]